MLVAGTRGTGNWSWPGLGSVSNQLASSAACPLLLILDDGIWRNGPVVTGVDGTPSSRRAIGFAFDEAHLRRVPVLAVCWSLEPAQARDVTDPWRHKYNADDLPGLLLGKVASEVLENAEHPIAVVR